MRPARLPALPGPAMVTAMVAAMVVGLLAGCGSQTHHANGHPALLVGPQLPGRPDTVSTGQRLVDAAPSWPCAGHEDRLLGSLGWSREVRRFGYADSNGRWMVTSALFTAARGSASPPAAQLLPRLQAVVRRCAAGGSHIADLGIVPASRNSDGLTTFTWQSWSRRHGFVEARRGYAVVDARHLVEVTVVGLHGTLAPPLVGGLLASAASRAADHLGS